MQGPSRKVRPPAVAGLFYPGDARQCTAAASEMLRVGGEHSASAPSSQKWIGGIVPHAGWICSGAIAGETIATIARQTQAPDVIVIFGAVHTPLPLDAAVLATHEQWVVPGGTSQVPMELSAKLEESASSEIAVDDRFHLREHAVEVELPLVQSAWPKARVLPIEVPLFEEAVQVGRETARTIAAAGLSAVYLASSDMTHYGPAYQFAPAGVGLGGLEWAKDNDRRLLEVVTDFAPERVVAHVRENLNACGGGAIAAMLAAARENGASTALTLRHANSFEVLQNVQGIGPQTPDNAVGYSAVVVA